MSTLNQTLKSRLASSETVQAALATAKAKQSKFQKTVASLEEVLYPELRARKVEKAMLELRDPDELMKARSLYAELSGPGALRAQERARTLCAEAFSEFRSALVPLLDAADATANDLASEVEVAETAMFSGFNEARVPTPLTAKVNAIVSEVRAMRSGLTTEPHHLALAVTVPSALGHIVDHFV